MTWLRVAIALPFGLAFGSFLTVAIDRVPKGESVVAPRSRCPACGTQIRAVDNVPLVSWILLRGRCRACREPISAAYPLTEAVTALLFVAAALTFDRVLVAAVMAVFLGLMPALSLIDARHRILPNRLIYPSLVAFPVTIVAGDLAGGGVDLVTAAIGLLAYGGGFLVVALVSPRGMGMGDVKLAALIGLVLGSLGLSYVGVAAGVGILLGGLGSLVALLVGASRKTAIPFGPFLAGGAVVAGLWGPHISGAYLRIVG